MEQNPNGSKDAFDKYFKALSQDDKKVCIILFLVSALTTDDSNHNSNAEVQSSRGRSSMYLDRLCERLTDSVISRKHLERKRIKVRCNSSICGVGTHKYYLGAVPAELSIPEQNVSA